MYIYFVLGANLFVTWVKCFKSMAMVELPQKRFFWNLFLELFCWHCFSTAHLPAALHSDTQDVDWFKLKLSDKCQHTSVTEGPWGVVGPTDVQLAELRHSQFYPCLSLRMPAQHCQILTFLNRRQKSGFYYEIFDFKLLITNLLKKKKTTPKSNKPKLCMDSVGARV